MPMHKIVTKCSKLLSVSEPKTMRIQIFFPTHIILAKHLFKIYVLILKITKKSSYFVTFIIFLSEYVVQGIFLHRNMTTI